MKHVLDKFSQSSLVVKLLLLMTLLLILTTGLLVSGPQENSETTRAITRTRKTDVTESSSTDVSSNDDQIRAEAEQAVKNLEDNQSDENVQSAKEAVSKLKDEDIQQSLNTRIQQVVEVIAARNRPTSSSDSQRLPSSETVIEETPAVEVPVTPAAPRPVEPSSETMDSSTSSESTVESSTTSTTEVNQNTTTTDTEWYVVYQE